MTPWADGGQTSTADPAPGTTSPAGPTAAPGGSRPTIRQGAFGDAVSTAQEELNSSTGAGLTVDGAFGRGTRAAVVSFQQAAGLDPDGAIGPATWSALDASAIQGKPVQGTSGGSSSGSGGGGTDPITEMTGGGLTPWGGGGTLDASAGGCHYEHGEKAAGQADPGQCDDIPLGSAGGSALFWGFAPGSSAIKTDHEEHIRRLIRQFDLWDHDPVAKVTLYEGSGDCVESRSQPALGLKRAQELQFRLIWAGALPENVPVGQAQSGQPPAPGNDRLSRARNRSAYAHLTSTGKKAPKVDPPKPTTCTNDNRGTEWTARITRSFTAGEVGCLGIAVVEIVSTSCGRKATYAFSGVGPCVGSLVGTSGSNYPNHFTTDQPVSFDAFSGPATWMTGGGQAIAGPGADALIAPSLHVVWAGTGVEGGDVSQDWHDWGAGWGGSIFGGLLQLVDGPDPVS